MKTSSVLKVLGAAAAVAALIPYKVEKDEETGATTMKALLWKAKHTPATEETGRDIDLTIGLNIPSRNSEAELYADDDPDAATLDAEELQVIADEAQETADEVQAIADEAQAAADEAQAAADEAQAIADEAQAAADEAAAIEADDDDESGSEF